MAVQPTIGKQHSHKQNKRLIYILCTVGAALPILIAGVYLSIYSVTVTRTVQAYFVFPGQTYTEQVYPYQQIGMFLLAVGAFILMVVIVVTAVIYALEKSYPTSKA